MGLGAGRRRLLTACLKYYAQIIERRTLLALILYNASVLDLRGVVTPTAQQPHAVLCIRK